MAQADSAAQRSSAIDLIARLGGVVVLILLVIIFTITLPDTFPTAANLRVLGAEQAVSAILAFGILLPLVAGEFDFSAGAVLSAATVAAVKIMEAGVPWALTVLLIVICASMIGLVNGFLVAVAGFNSFVATLATSGVIAGTALMVSSGQNLFEGVPQSYLNVGRNEMFGIPLPIVYAIVVYAIVAWVLRQSAWGRRHEAVGKGRQAAELAGVSIRRHLLVSFAGSAALASLAGCLLVARLGSSPPDIGNAYILSAFAAAFLGGTMLRPGFFNATGTLLAIALIAIGVNGLALAGVSSFVGQVFTGITLLLAVTLSRLENRTLKWSRRGEAPATDEIPPTESA